MVCTPPLCHRLAGKLNLVNSPCLLATTLVPAWDTGNEPAMSVLICLKSTTDVPCRDGAVKCEPGLTGESYRPDLLLECRKKSILYITELTVGFKTNLESNAHRKRDKY